MKFSHVPNGVMRRIEAQAAVDREALDRRIVALGLGTEKVDGVLTRVRHNLCMKWVVPPELKSIDERAAEWLAGVESMALVD